MNSATIVYLFGVLCVLASPSFAAPPEVNRNAADDAKNELTSDLSNDAETFQPVNNQGGAPSVGPPVPANAPVAPNAPDAPKTPEFIGGGTGIITKIGFEGEFICRNITCPPETEMCKYTSEFNPDGKTAKVQYKCYGKNDAVLLSETRTEPVDTSFGSGAFDFDHIFSSITDRMNSFFNDMMNSFRM